MQILLMPKFYIHYNDMSIYFQYLGSAHLRDFRNSYN
jgi:hypothetical protein